MDASEFVSPLEVIQVISMFSYLNTLSDFLYVEKYLNENDQHKRIPVVNALYHYLHISTDEQGTEKRKLFLAKKLINGTDLYGANETEIPDPYFIDTLFKHIINSLVFDRFVNVYGFIADVVRNSNNDSLKNLLATLKDVLRRLRFENEYGDDSQLTPFTIDKIFTSLIEPLFPRSKNVDPRFTSIDYIYSMAGKMFLKFDESTGRMDEILNRAVEGKGTNEYQEYVEVAHMVEQLVLAKGLDKGALKIFALPALINYVYKERVILESKTTADVVSSKHHWQEAYKSLFTHLNDSFSLMEQIRKLDTRYGFYSALANFKNRSTLAREQLEMNCVSLTEGEIEQEIIRYKNNPKDYKCKFSEDGKSLEDINSLFEDMIDDISDKYYLYEKEYCQKAFGHLPKSMTPNVVVSKGLIQYYYFGQVGIQADSVQLVNEKHDLLQFYYPDSGQYVYYALVRNGYNISLIKESDNPKLFRKTLGLNEYETFRSNNFPDVLKTQQEDFHNLSVKIADKRMKIFRKELQTVGYGETSKEWWTNFALSLIPFYTCVKDLKEENLAEAEFVCPLDAVFLIPVVQEMGILSKNLVSFATRTIYESMETTLRTVTIRTSIRSILRLTSRSIIDEFDHFGDLFKNFGIALLRFIDPGFELAFTIGQNGLRYIRSLVLQVERRLSIRSKFIRGQLFRARYATSHFSRRIGRMFGRDTYVNSIFSFNSGYGWKYIPIKGDNIAEIRTVHPLMMNVPLVRDVSFQEGKITEFSTKETHFPRRYREVNIDTGEIVGNEFFENEEGVIVSEERSFEFSFVMSDSYLSEAPNLICKEKCPKSSLERLTEAVNFATRNRRLREDVVRHELKNYVFPNKGRTELDFVTDWTNRLEVPEWAQEYRVDEPEIFYDLKHKETFDVAKLTESEAKERIEILYPDNEIFSAMGETLAEDYIDRQVFRFQTFEDYFAIRNYCSNGYRRMSQNTVESRRMKNAIYRLAIRQSEDSVNDYASVLFRGESRLSEIVDELFVRGEEFTFDRFTSVTTELPTAVSFLRSGKYPYRKVVYEMKFSEPYLRAKVQDLSRLQENESILLPGTKFQISDVEFENGEHDYVMVKLKQREKNIAEWQMEVMKEIKKLKESGTIFYPLS